MSEKPQITESDLEGLNPLELLAEWRKMDDIMAEVCKLLKCNKKDVLKKIDKINENISRMEKRLAGAGNLKQNPSGSASVVTYIRNKRLLLIKHEHGTAAWEDVSQQKARAWLDKNGYFNNGMNLWLGPWKEVDK